MRSIESMMAERPKRAGRKPKKAEKQLPAKDEAATARIEVAGAAAAWKRIRDLSDSIRAEYQALDATAARDHSWTMDMPGQRRHGCGER